ncbi:MAG: PQQ-binding-like beta-propeller repeat protein [Acidimicrobiales bacterium]
MPSSTGSERRWALVLAAVAVAVAVTGTILVLRQDDRGWAIESDSSTVELVADDRTVCGANRDNELFCLDAASGRELFSEQHRGRPRPFSIVDGTLLVGDDNIDTATEVPDGTDGRARLLAYTLDGDLLWEAPLDIGQLEPAVADGVVAVTTEADAELVGLDLTTGEERWRTTVSPTNADPGSGQTFGQVYADGGSFYVAFAVFGGLQAELESAVVAIDPASGTERWRSAIAGSDLPPHSMAPVDDGGAVAFVVGPPTRHRRIVVLDTATGRLRWQEPLTDDAATIAQVDDVIVTLTGTELRGVDADGDELWTTDAPTGHDPDTLADLDLTVSVLGRLFAAGGSLYLHSSQLYEVDPRTGASHAVVDDPLDEVVLTDDHLVIADTCCPARIGARPR